MKKSDVQLGSTYTAKVSGQLTTVRIVGPSPYGGWNALNLATGRYIHIKTAGRLRKTVNPSGRTDAQIRAVDMAHVRQQQRQEETVTPGPNVNSPDTVAHLASLRLHPETCPVCHASNDLDRTMDHDTHTAEVICCTCNAGWTERYNTGKLVGVAFDSGAVATA